MIEKLEYHPRICVFGGHDRDGHLVPFHFKPRHKAKWLLANIHYFEIENEFMEGFELFNLLGTPHIKDPRGFALPLTGDGLTWLLKNSTIVNGVIMGRRAWAVNGKSRGLIRPEDLELINRVREENAVKIKEVQVGNVLSFPTKPNKKYYYLGHYYYPYDHDYSSSTKGMKKTHIFCDIFTKEIITRTNPKCVVFDKQTFSKDDQKEYLSLLPLPFFETKKQIKDIRFFIKKTGGSTGTSAKLSIIDLDYVRKNDEDYGDLIRKQTPNLKYALRYKTKWNTKVFYFSANIMKELNSCMFFFDDATFASYYEDATIKYCSAKYGQDVEIEVDKYGRREKMLPSVIQEILTTVAQPYGE